MDNNILDRLNNTEQQQTAFKDRFGLEYNPFPRSGIAIINENDKISERLMPVDNEVIDLIINFIRDSVYNSKIHGSAPDKYMSMIVRGEYGSGKTQTLMFIRYLLTNLQNESVRPYVVYIDNPGQKLSELIGGIVNQIGVENFRKYLWSIFISYLDSHADIKQALIEASKVIPDANLFSDGTPTTSLSTTIQNYKEFVEALTAGAKNATERRQLLQDLKGYMITSYTEETGTPVVANYFYDVVSETIGVSKSWDMLVTGNVKELDKREVSILSAIVNIVCKQLGYTDFFILVDEFEEITADRLKRTDIDNYLRNLRLLIDREKNWCSVFAMTGKALEIIDSYSPPLAGRIKGSVIDLKPLDMNGLKQMVQNYLSLAREDGSEPSIAPFAESGLEAMLQIKNPQLKGSPRFILKLCYQLLQRATTELPEGRAIDQEFVEQYIDDFLK